LNDQQPEGSQPSAANGGDNTASYNKRFLAFVIDVFLIALMIMFFLRFLGIDAGPVADMQTAQAELIKKLEALSESQKMLLTFSPIISFFILHGFLLYHRGQTLGKKMMGIAIVTLDNQKPAFMPLIAQRYFSQWLIGMLPVVGLPLRLLDVLMIFRGDKRCLHDLIAKTKVIDLSIKVVVSPNSLIA
jgi:uncharacterized RDD family membrane protein YckC